MRYGFLESPGVRTKPTACSDSSASSKALGEKQEYRISYT